MGSANHAQKQKIDILRGTAAIAVILAHAVQRGMVEGFGQALIWKVIYAWHMPIFVLLSGYSLSFSNLETASWQFIRKKAQRLLWPMLCWSFIIWFMRDLPFVGIQPFIVFPDSIFEYARQLFWNPTYVYWFLYVIFIYTFLIWVILRVSGPYWGIVLFSVLCFVYAAPEFGLFGWYWIRRFSIFFCIGYVLALSPYHLNGRQLPVAIVSILCGAGYLLTKFFGYGSETMHFVFLAVFSCWCVERIVAAAIFLASKSRFISRICDGLSLAGRYSLELYLCQTVCLNIGIGEAGTLLRIITIFCSATALSW